MTLNMSMAPPSLQSNLVSLDSNCVTHTPSITPTPVAPVAVTHSAVNNANFFTSPAETQKPTETTLCYNTNKRRASRRIKQLSSASSTCFSSCSSTSSSTSTSSLTSAPRHSTSSSHSVDSNADSSCAMVLRNLRFLFQQERRTHNLAVLRDSTSLDNLARLQAHYMAETEQVEPAFANEQDLAFMLNCHDNQAVGEHVQTGLTPLALHMASLKTKKSLLLCPLFDEYGLGVARGKHGQLFMCQLFRQR